MSDLDERLNKILPRVISDDFLSGTGIGNEVAFYIFDYPPEEELRVRDFLRVLLDHLPKQKPDLRFKHVNLFDFVLDYLNSRNLLDKAVQMQKEKGDEALKKALAGPLHPEKLALAFGELVQPQQQDLVIASGVGSVYPHEEYDKEGVRRCLEYALEARRRVKEQLKKIGGMEFFDVHFSYLDQETLEEKFISVPEQGGGMLIPDGPLSPGVMHAVATGTNGHLGLYRLETQVTAGNGALKTSGLGSNNAAREATRVGFDYFKANASRISASIKAGDHDYHFHVVELHNTGPTTALTLAAFVALCSGVLGRPLQSQLVVLGTMSLGGNIVPVENLAESLQVAFDAGAKRILLPMASVRDIPTIPGELFAKFQTSSYSDPTDAVFKALGVQ